MPRSLLLTAVLLAASVACVAGAGCPEGTDCADITVSVDIAADEVLRHEPLTAFFSFNMNHYRFERDLLRKNGDVAPGPVESLRELPGVYYRYPGGLVSNSFDWQAAVGPVAGRAPQASVDHSAPATVRFGVDEYFRFVDEVGGKPWYVLNLLGWSASKPDTELPLDQVAESNAALARHIAGLKQAPRYFQLGNELDRATYQWPVEKYVERSKASMAAVRRSLPDARFVAFLRDFDWTYKGKQDPRAGSKSRYQDFIPAVLDGLPDVDDFSLHFYYDDPGVDKRTKRIGWRLRQIQSAVDVATAARNGKTPNVWITEHARGVNLGMGKGMQRAALTSDLAATISTADFLIGLAGIPAVKGAFWHGINAGPWQLFDATINHRDLRPRPVYWGYRVLQSVLLEETLRTETGTQRDAQYVDGYDVRTVAFRGADGNVLGLWVANRRDEPVRLAVTYAPYAGRAVAIRQFELYGALHANADETGFEPTVELDPEAVSGQVDAEGRFEVIVKPSSVTALEVRRR